jgi:hypothetical protein
MNRTITCLALVCVGSFASASFELALVLDGGTKKVHRYDAVTGAYLGSFGSFVSPVSIVVNKSKNEAIVFDAAFTVSNAAAYHFNYNTGELKYVAGGIASQVDWASPRNDGTGYYFINSSFGGYFDYDASWLGGSAAVAGVLNPTRADIDGNNRMLLAHSTNKVSLINTASKAALVTNTAAIANVTDIAYTPISAFGGTLAIGSANTGALQLFNVNDASITVGYSLTAASTGFATINGVSTTHQGVVAVGTGAGGGTLLKNFVVGRGTAFNQSYLGSPSSFALSQVTAPVDIATVVAPEPATYAVMVIGLLGLRKRRR